MCATHDLTITLLPPCLLQDIMDAATLQALVSDKLCHRHRWDMQDVRFMKAICGSDCWTDHCFMFSKLSFCILPMRKPQGQKSAKKLNVYLVKNSTIADDFLENFKGKLSGAPLNDRDSIYTKWASFRDLVYATALECLGQAANNTHSWFDEWCDTSTPV